MEENQLDLLVTNTVTYIHGKFDKGMYQMFKKHLSYQPEDAIFRIKNTDNKNSWSKKWDGSISTVCFNKTWCRCSIKRDGTHFPTGLLSKAREFFDENNIKYRRIDKREQVEKTLSLKMSEDFEERDYQLDIVDKSISQQRGIIKLATGGGKCIHKDSLCLCEDGLLSLEEIVKENNLVFDTSGYSKINKLVFTDMVDGNFDVSSHIYKNGISDNIKITTKSGFNLEAVPSHKIRVICNDIPMIQWKNISDLNVGDYVISIKGSNVYGKNRELDKDDAYWMGILTGDGCLTRKNQVNLLSQDAHILDFSKKYLDDRNIKYHLYKDKRRKRLLNLNILSKDYKNVVTQMGLDSSYSYQKEIPISIRKSTKPIIAEFIKGLYETYGFCCCEKSKVTLSIALSSKKIIDQLHLILLNFGILSTRRTKLTSHKNSYVLTIYNDNINIFLKEIGLDRNGYKYEKCVNGLKNLSHKKNSNNDLIPYCNSHIKFLMLEIKKYYDVKYINITLNNFNLKYQTIRSWSGDKYWRKPSRLYLKRFVLWAMCIYQSLKKNGEKSEYNNILDIIEVLKYVLNNNYHYEKIVKIEKSKNLTYDFVIPKSHSFLSQGMINHNTSVAARIIQELSISPFIFYVPSIDLLQQAHDELSKFIRSSGSNLEVGIIGNMKCDIKDINVMTVQTAIRAIGEKWKKFDDEEKSDKKSSELDDNSKKIVKELIMSSKGMICDEVQHWASDTCQIISDYSVSSKYRYGMSVFSDSFIELYGDIFEGGYAGSIENMWNMLENKGMEMYSEDNYEIVNLDGVYSRGWNGYQFQWKPVSKLIRHLNNKVSYKITFAGKDNLKLTEDHSVFRIKNQKIECCRTKNLHVGDILLIDNGTGWDSHNKLNLYNAIDILSSIKNKGLRVGLDLSKASANNLQLDYMVFYQLKHRGFIADRFGGSLSMRQYLDNKSILSNPEWIYCGGCHKTGIAADLNIDDIAYMLGFFTGDGWLDGNRINFAVENSFVSKFLNKIKSNKYNINPKIRIMKGNSVEVRISCKPLAEYIRYFMGSDKCYNKKIPAAILFSKEKSRRLFLEGLIDSDGSRKKQTTDIVHNRSPVRVTTTSKNLLNGIELLLRSFNVQYTISKRPPAKGGIINGRQIKGRRSSYQVIFSENALLGNNIGKFGNIKKTSFNCIEKKVLKIQEIESNIKQYVYDMEMVGHPSFVANGVLVHNSATPFRDKGDDILIDSCFGKVIADVNASFLIDKGYLVPPNIYFVKVNNMKGTAFPTYDVAYRQSIVENNLRNSYIANIANGLKEQGKVILILCRHIDHGKILSEMIDGSEFLHGSWSGKKRKEHLDKMRNSEACVTIASTIFDEGIDCRPLDTLILAGSGISQTRALQRVGRTLRPYKGKTEAIIIDFEDNCKYMLKHSRKRKKIYQTEPRFEIKYLDI